MDEMDVVLACRRIAVEVWRGQRSRDVWEAGGINDEDVLRSRLLTVRQDTLRQSSLRKAARADLAGIDIAQDASVDVLAGCEAAARAQLPGRFADAQTLLHGTDALTFQLVRLLVLQGLAARLGHWAVTPDGVEDVRTARRLYLGLPAPDWLRFRGLHQTARAAFAAGNHQLAVRSDLTADRMVRTPAGLVRVAAALRAMGDLEGGRWAIRAALLEPPHRFEGLPAHQAALRLERSLMTATCPPRRAPPIEAELLTPPGGVVTAKVPRPTRLSPPPLPVPDRAPETPSFCRAVLGPKTNTEGPRAGRPAASVVIDVDRLHRAPSRRPTPTPPPPVAAPAPARSRRSTPTPTPPPPVAAPAPARSLRPTPTPPPAVAAKSLQPTPTPPPAVAPPAPARSRRSTPTPPPAVAAPAPARSLQPTPTPPPAVAAPAPEPIPLPRTLSSARPAPAAVTADPAGRPAPAAVAADPAGRPAPAADPPASPPLRRHRVGVRIASSAHVPPPRRVRVRAQSKPLTVARLATPAPNDAHQRLLEEERSRYEVVRLPVPDPSEEDTIASMPPPGFDPDALVEPQVSLLTDREIDLEIEAAFRDIIMDSEASAARGVAAEGPSEETESAVVIVPAHLMAHEGTHDVLSREILGEAYASDAELPAWAKIVSETISVALATLPQPEVTDERASSREDVTEPGTPRTALERLRVYALSNLPSAVSGLARPATPAVIPVPSELVWALGPEPETDVEAKIPIDLAATEPATSANALAGPPRAAPPRRPTERTEFAIDAAMAEASRRHYEETMRVRARRAPLPPLPPTARL